MVKLDVRIKSRYSSQLYADVDVSTTEGFSLIIYG